MSSGSSGSGSGPCGSVSVFEKGKYRTEIQAVEGEKSSAIGPPKPILIGTPVEAEGEFPVLILLHGFLLFNSFYSQLIHHVASHGFLVIAPQLYWVAGPDATEEITSTAEVADWIPKGLQKLLPPEIHPNLSKIALAGHSRGGKVAFALAIRRLTAQVKFSALIGIDPVDGMSKGNQTPPPVLTYVPHSFHIQMPVLVIGSGLGEVKKNPLFPACAPNGVNHREFFRECRKPAAYFVAKDYGHLDMLDDETKGIRGRVSYCLCENGKAREPMRRFVGGLIVAFMEAYLCGDDTHLVAIRDAHEPTPLDIEVAEFFY